MLEKDVLHLQLQFWNVLSESTVAYLNACTAAVEAQVSAHADALATQFDALNGSADESQGKSERRPAGSMFEMPEVPRAARSWYRAPIENPTLAFWDAMWRPWRTYQTQEAWTSVTGMASKAPLDWLRLFQTGHSALAVNSMSDMWANAFPMMSNVATYGQSRTNVAVPEGKRTNSVGSQQFEAPFGFAVATVRFPDSTEVTLTLPVATLPFMASYPMWPKK